MNKYEQSSILERSGTYAKWSSASRVIDHEMHLSGTIACHLPTRQRSAHPSLVNIIITAMHFSRIHSQNGTRASNNEAMNTNKEKAESSWLALPYLPRIYLVSWWKHLKPKVTVIYTVSLHFSHAVRHTALCIMHLKGQNPFFWKAKSVQERGSVETSPPGVSARVGGIYPLAHSG